MTSRPRAVMVCPMLPFPPYSGSDKRALRLLETMEQAGALPHVVTADLSRPEGAAALRERGWRVDVVAEARQPLGRRAGQHLGRRPGPYLHGVAGALRAATAHGTAFVQLEQALSSFYGSIPRHPWALSMHNVDSEMLATVARAQRPGSLAWTRAWNRALSTRSTERRWVPRADAVLCVSDDDAAHFERVGGQPIVVPNGVDDDLFDIPAEPPLAERVLFFGRLDYEPNALGLERFVREGWPRLVSRRPDARLVIVGPGLLERTARLLSAAPRCETLGLVTDLPAELATARLVIVPIWQGGGTRLKVLESLAAARPLVGTPLGVAGIGFRDGVHGVLADDPTGLADAAAALLADPARSTELAVAGRGLATRFRWSTATAPAAALYERWIG